MNIQVETCHYFNIDYDIKERFITYWHQINQIILVNPREILEIGIGNGFVSKYLKERNFNIVTLDIDYRLFPAVVGNVLQIPFLDRSFDAVACFELLEHLPYKNFPEALKELYRVSRSYIIISLPDVTTAYRFYIELPRIRPIRKMFKHPFPRESWHHFDGQHYWEIGKRGYSLKRIEEDIRRSGLKIVNTYRIFEVKHRRFFLLSGL